MREEIRGHQGALGDVIWAQPLAITRNQARSSAIKEASTTRARRLERIVHDCEEELHDEEAAEHDDEEEVDPHVPDDGCNQTSSSATIKRQSAAIKRQSGRNQDVPREGLHQVVIRT